MQQSTNQSGIKDLIHVAIKNKNIISIEYEKDDGSFSKRKLYPITVQRYRKKEYLEAFCLLRKNNRIFKFKNIKKIIFFKKKYLGNYPSILKIGTPLINHHTKIQKKLLKKKKIVNKNIKKDSIIRSKTLEKKPKNSKEIFNIFLIITVIIVIFVIIGKNQ